jgi:hypothetical protein
MQGVGRYGAATAELDSQGNIHVVYALDEGLYHVVWDGSGWGQRTLVAPVLSAGTTAVWTRLATRLGHELHAVWYEGFPALSMPERDQRLSRGEYEIRHSRRPLSVPAVAAQPELVTPVTVGTLTATAPLPEQDTVEPVSTAAPASTAARLTASLAAPLAAPTAGTASPILAAVISSLILVAVVVFAQARRRR